ncbi:hypothetical protein HMSSN036_12860 [Paenibacillus macerans]|nr:hypothetical protein HMSSN036_12860 [Paenibacillus macerans]
MAAFFKNVLKNKVMLFMVLPGAVWFFFFSYLPLVGTVAAFKQYRFSREGFWASLAKSEWVGWDNFKFLFMTDDAFTITRNTLLYNLAFIFIGLVLSVAMAIILSELAGKVMAKVYQTGMFLPYFLSWVIVGYFAFSFLSMDRGMLNQILGWFAPNRSIGIRRRSIGRIYWCSSICGKWSATTALCTWLPLWASTNRCTKRP